MVKKSESRLVTEELAVKELPNLLELLKVPQLGELGFWESGSRFGRYRVARVYYSIPELIVSIQD